MTPSGVRPDQDEKIGVIEVLVGARDGIGAKGADVAGNRGGHAQTRIRVHVRRADETFHQLVGDVIVLGQELAGEIEGKRIGPVPLADALEAVATRSSASGQSTRARLPSGCRSMG